MSQDNPASDSSYPPFKQPTEFEPQIPEYLLTNATQFEKHVISELSVMRQMDRWTVETLANTNDLVRRTNGKANRAEADIKAVQADVTSLQQDKRLVVRGWRLFAAVCIGLTGVIGFLLSIYSALH